MEWARTLLHRQAEKVLRSRHFRAAILFLPRLLIFLMSAFCCDVRTGSLMYLWILKAFTMIIYSESILVGPGSRLKSMDQ